MFSCNFTEAPFTWSWKKHAIQIANLSLLWAMFFSQSRPTDPKVEQFSSQPRTLDFQLFMPEGFWTQIVVGSLATQWQLEGGLGGLGFWWQSWFEIEISVLLHICWCFVSYIAGCCSCFMKEGCNWSCTSFVSTIMSNVSLIFIPHLMIYNL